MTQVAGHRWFESGQSAYTGPALQGFERLDCLFRQWGASVRAQEHVVPPFLSAKELAKIDYLRSFPHLATFPVSLDPAKENLTEFANRGGMSDEGVQLSQTAPVREVLTPAACYHFYVTHQGSDFDAAQYLTTRTMCFRREATYTPLQRQSGFSMREIVCIGTVDEVKAFLDGMRERVDAFLRESRLSAAWKVSTDPFFDPSSDPKFLAQKVEPLKRELVFGPDNLALGSVNFHRNYFGGAFGIRRNGEVAASGCIGFGIDRWIHALAQAFGNDPDQWPLSPSTST
jgi:hypothetical protein